MCGNEELGDLQCNPRMEPKSKTEVLKLRSVVQRAINSEPKTKSRLK